MIDDDNIFGKLFDDFIGSSREFEDEDDGESFVTSKEKSKENENNDNNNYSNQIYDIEECLHFKSYAREKAHVYTEKEMKDIELSCSTTLVHDFSEYDEYHISDEERMRIDSLYSMAEELDKLKTIYSNVSEFVDAWRTVMKAWALVDKYENFIHDTDEFYELIASGIVTHPRIPRPQLKRKKAYNMDKIIEYISNPQLDSKELLTNDERRKLENRYTFYTMDDDDYEQEEDRRNRLLTQEERDYIDSHRDNPPQLEVLELDYDKWIKGYNENVYSMFDKKKKKKKKNMSRKERNDEVFREDIHSLLRTIESNPNYNNLYRSSYMSGGLFEQEPDKFEKLNDIVYDGSWGDKDDVDYYRAVLFEALMNTRTREHSIVTYRDVFIENFFEELESEGINVTELRRNMNRTTKDMNRRTVKEERKKLKKIEDDVLNRTLKLNNSKKFIKLVTKCEEESKNRISKESRDWR